MTVDVVFVAGVARSGSTLLDTLLAEALERPSTGELVLVFKRGLIEDRPCRCGEAFSACRFWCDVVATAPSLLTRDVAREVVRATDAVTRGLSSRSMLTGRGRRALLEMTPALWYDAMGALYEGVAQVAGTTALVDSSKLPVLALLLDRVPGLRIHPVHLVRDPRAVAWSWSHPHQGVPGVPDFPSLPPAKAAVLWLVVNMATERLPSLLGEPRTRVRYEDLVDDPGPVVESAARALSGAMGDGHPTGLDAGAHTMAGNPGVRLSSGDEPIVGDERWRSGLGCGAACAVSTITMPLLHRYGYPLRPGLGSGRAPG